MSARQYTDQLQKLDTPFYFYDMQLLADTLAKAVAEAGKYGYKVHYALRRISTRVSLPRSAKPDWESTV